MTDTGSVQKIGQILCDPKQSLTERFRALFTLRNLGGHAAVDAIAKCFGDPSALLKHELAYCLGQMGVDYAIPYLLQVLRDTNQEPMVRHEAGEALGAIGSESVLDVLKQYSQDPVVEVAETCQLAVQRIEWLHSKSEVKEKLSENPYKSVDPAPPALEKDIQSLEKTLLDEQVPLFDRYRAMFSLRNIGSNEAVAALAQGLECNSALFRHEIAYVLGQMQHEGAIAQLTKTLQKNDENPMVRHECAEALGSIAKDECMKTLEEYATDKEQVVKESCVVAIDMYQYENSDQFQYADGLVKVHQTDS